MDGNKFAGRLLKRETLVWTGRPRGGLMLTGRDAFLIPFSLLWCGFAVFWEAEVYAKGAPRFMLVFGGAFVCMGLFFVFGRFILDAWVRARTFYAVTDRRVLILREGPWGSFQALSLDRLRDTTLVEQSGGHGTSRFGQPVRAFNGQASSMTPAFDPTPQFLAIPDATRVFALVQERAQVEPRVP